MVDPGNADFLEEPDYTVIETERLILRTFAVSDAEAMLPILADPEVMKWTSQSNPITEIAAARRWVSARALGKDVFNFAIELKQGASGEANGDPRKLIGVIGSRELPEIGYLLHPDHHGKGYATEALRAIIPALFERMPPAAPGGPGFNCIVACTDCKNTASRRVLEKGGLTYCETFEDDLQPPGSEPKDLAIYRIARPGYTLESLGLLVTKTEQTRDDELIPPIQ